MPKHPLGEIDRAAVQERKHIRNLAETPGYTGTFTSSAGKSDAVIRAEQDAADRRKQAASTKATTEATERFRRSAEASEARKAADIAKLDSEGQFSKRKNLDAIATQLGMSAEGAYGFLERIKKLDILDQNFDPKMVIDQPTLGDQNDALDEYEGLFASEPLAEYYGDPASRLASSNIQNMLSNIFGPEGRSATKAPETELARLMKMISSFGGDMFSDDRSADRRKGLDDIFAMMQGFTSMQPSQLGP